MAILHWAFGVSFVRDLCMAVHVVLSMIACCSRDITLCNLAARFEKKRVSRNSVGQDAVSHLERSGSHIITDVLVFVPRARLEGTPDKSKADFPSLAARSAGCSPP